MREPSSVVIEEGGLEDPQVLQLLERHLELMRSQSPPESTHALDIEGLSGPDICFWTAWDDGAALGCGALKTLDAMSGEIKSMHTAESARGRGIASLMLNHIETTAQQTGLQRLYLETGTPSGFLPARRLYETFDYTTCGPFADYVEDPFSVFMVKELR